VAGIQRLIEEQRIVEPLTSFYKDEVRAVGRELGLPDDLLERHPFPGPGLAIRCLCSAESGLLQPVADGWVAPIRSVGVQGDSRSYRHVLALDGLPTADAGLHDKATELINRTAGVNRAIAFAGGRVPLADMAVHQSALTPQRLARLRRADAIVRRFTHSTGFDKTVWQFPVVLVPLGTADAPDSVVLRPVDSVDGMTAQSVPMEPAALRALTAELLGVAGVSAVFYDLTHKPPATIEWE